MDAGEAAEMAGLVETADMAEVADGAEMPAASPVRRGRAARTGPEPTVIAEDVHVVYRPEGGGSSGRGSAVAALSRILGGVRNAGARGGRKTGDAGDRPERNRGSTWNRNRDPNRDRTRDPARDPARTRERGMREVHAVRGVSFTAYRGEAIGLIGSNGSGKSTLLKAVAGLLPAERGTVYTGGQPSLLGVNAALMNDLTGEKNVLLGGLAMGMSREGVRERYEDIVRFSGIDERGDFVSLPMRTYSSGMSARLRFSIAAAKEHDVLMIDEGLATGDAAFQRRSEARIRELRERAGTVFLVSHNNKSIRDTCDRTLWLESGELRMDGPTEEVVRAYEKETAKAVR